MGHRLTVAYDNTSIVTVLTLSIIYHKRSGVSLIAFKFRYFISLLLLFIVRDMYNQNRHAVANLTLVHVSIRLPTYLDSTYNGERLRISQLVSQARNSHQQTMHLCLLLGNTCISAKAEVRATNLLCEFCLW